MKETNEIRVGDSVYVPTSDLRHVTHYRWPFEERFREAPDMDTVVNWNREITVYMWEGSSRQDCEVRANSHCLYRLGLRFYRKEPFTRLDLKIEALQEGLRSLADRIEEIARENGENE